MDDKVIAVIILYWVVMALLLALWGQWAGAAMSVVMIYIFLLGVSQ